MSADIEVHLTLTTLLPASLSLLNGALQPMHECSMELCYHISVIRSKAQQKRLRQRIGAICD